MYLCGMKKPFFILAFLALLSFSNAAFSQCSLCTKTASQLGEKPAKALNSGIIYLMMAPLAIGGSLMFWWWKRNGSRN